MPATQGTNIVRIPGGLLEEKICLFIRAGNVRTSDKGLSVPDKEDKPFDNAPQSQIPRQESSYSLERSFVLTKFVDVDIVDKN